MPLAIDAMHLEGVRVKSTDLMTHAGDHIGRCFGVSCAPCLVTVPVKRAVFSVTRLSRQVSRGVPVPVRLPRSDAYFLMLYLDDVSHCDIRQDGSVTQASLYPRGSICLVDLKEGVSIMLRSRLDSLAFIIPYDLFDELGDISPDFGACGLRCRRGKTDAVIGHIGAALLPLFERGEFSSSATLRHMAIALCAHLLHDYGQVPQTAHGGGPSQTALSVEQEKAAKDFVLENLQKNLSVSLIAAAAGVSSRHLSLGFREATGMTPHQWLMHIRIAHAKEFLMQRSLSLQTIAHRCGFTDQSHFSRVFSRETGMTPAIWRTYLLQ